MRANYYGVDGASAAVRRLKPEDRSSSDQAELAGQVALQRQKMATAQLYAAGVMQARSARQGMGSGAPGTADDGTSPSDGGLPSQSSGDSDGEVDIGSGGRDGGGGGSSSDGRATSAQEDPSRRQVEPRGKLGGASGLSPSPLAEQHLPQRSGAGASREAVFQTIDAHLQPVHIVMTGPYTPGPGKGNRSEVQEYFKLSRGQADAVIFYSKVHMCSGQRSHACLSVGTRGRGKAGGRGCPERSRDPPKALILCVFFMFCFYMQM